MHEVAPFPLEAWQSFYVIVGSSAGALTGLQFVVLTLIGESDVNRARDETISAFGTPNVVHFCAALLVSAIFSAPWRGLVPPGVATTLCGVLGVIYSVTVLVRARRQRGYEPVLEDWLWHVALPMVAYAALLLGGIGLARVSAALYVVGAAALLLVFIGIHNAWDTVTYVTSDAFRRAPEKIPAGSAEPPPAVPPAPPAGKAIGLPSPGR